MVGRVMGRLRPGRRDAADIQRGLAAVERLAPFGTGQAVVVMSAYLVALAAAESVTAMLERVRALRPWGIAERRRRGVLVCRGGLVCRGRHDAAERDQLRHLLALASAQDLAGIALTGPPAALAGAEELGPRLADAQGLFLVTCHQRFPGARANGASELSDGQP
jgi:DUF1009 family protein